MKTFALPFSLALLTACTPPPLVEPLPLLAGYRHPGDQCVRVSESGFTNQFLDDAADLVGCPVGYEGTGVFVTETGGVLVAETQGYQLYTVARR